MKSKIGITFMTIGVMLIVAALSLVAYNIYADNSAEKKSHEILTILEEEINERLENNSISINANPTNNDETSNKNESIVINDNEYIGIIYIPDINIKLPVMKQWNYDNLKISPCRYNGDVKYNDLIIAAHNYSSHFGQLKHLVCDDLVYFIDVNGKTHDYVIKSIEIVNGQDVDKMLSGDWPLTLFTCNFNGSARVTIRCDILENNWRKEC